MDDATIDPKTSANPGPCHGDARFDDRILMGTTHGLRVDGSVTLITCYRGRHLPRWTSIGSDHTSENARIVRFIRGQTFDSIDAFRAYCACLLKAPVTWDTREADSAAPTCGARESAG